MEHFFSNIEQTLSEKVKMRTVMQRNNFYQFFRNRYIEFLPSVISYEGLNDENVIALYFNGNTKSGHFQSYVMEGQTAPKHNHKKQCSISFCRTVLVDEQGNMQSAGPPNLNSGIYDGGSFIRDFMSIGNSIVNASSVLFSKECLQSISGDYQLFQGAGDRLFWIWLSFSLWLKCAPSREYV